VKGIPGFARENTEKCLLKNKWQCPTTLENAVRPLGLTAFIKKGDYRTKTVITFFGY